MMKKRIIFMLPVCAIVAAIAAAALFMSVPVKQELEEYDLFYWVNGERIQLYHPENVATIFMDRVFGLEEMRSRLGKFENVVKVEAVPTIEYYGGGYGYSKEAFFIEHVYEDELDFVSALRQEPNVRAADIALYVDKGANYSYIFLTDRIVASIKPENEQAFLNAIGGWAAISEKKQRWEHLVYYLTLDYKRTKSNSLNLANRLHDLDSTEWSSPDFISMISMDV